MFDFACNFNTGILENLLKSFFMVFIRKMYKLSLATSEENYIVELNIYILKYYTFKFTFFENTKLISRIQQLLTKLMDFFKKSQKNKILVANSNRGTYNKIY